MRKLAVCYPGDMASVFMAPFQSMLNIAHPEGCVVKWFRGVGWCQARRRTHGCEQALEWGADLIAQLDVDQIYEPDVLCRLVARFDEGFRVIAAMVPGRCYVKASKMPPFARLAWRSTCEGTDWEPVDPAAGDVQECDFPTSACTLFAADDLRQVKMPWFFNKYDTKTMKLVQGEDAVLFLRMKKDLGVKAYVDATIKVKHAHVFGIDETFSDRFADWAEGGGEPEICNYD